MTGSAATGRFTTRRRRRFDSSACGTPSARSASRNLHRSALDRHEGPPIYQAPYHPTTCLAVGESKAIDVFACEKWNDTELYLTRGDYKLTATGEWLDKSIPCGPEGGRDGRFHLGEAAHLVGSGIGVLERLWRRGISEDADFKATRRHEDVPWFALTGVVAHKLPKPRPDGSPRPFPHFKIGREHDLSVKEPGYLYAYANDAWDFYGNNRADPERHAHVGPRRVVLLRRQAGARL